MSDTVDQSKPLSVDGVEHDSTVANVESSAAPVDAKSESVVASEVAGITNEHHSHNLLVEFFHAVCEDARGVSHKIESLIVKAKDHLGL